MQRVGIVSIPLLVAGLVAALPAQPPQGQSSQIEHGKYLVEKVAMCVECHTRRNTRGELDRNKLLQGAPIPLQSPFRNQQWAFQAPDIAGLPGWTTQDAIRLLQTGRRMTGLSPKPPMPSYRLTQVDAEAVVAYLKSMR